MSASSLAHWTAPIQVAGDMRSTTLQKTGSRRCLILTACPPTPSPQPVTAHGCVNCHSLRSACLLHAFMPLCLRTRTLHTSVFLGDRLIACPTEDPPSDPNHGLGGRLESQRVGCLRVPQPGECEQVSAVHRVSGCYGPITFIIPTSTL